MRRGSAEPGPQDLCWRGPSEIRQGGPAALLARKIPRPAPHGPVYSAAGSHWNQFSRRLLQPLSQRTSMREVSESAKCRRWQYAYAAACTMVNDNRKHAQPLLVLDHGDTSKSRAECASVTLLSLIGVRRRIPSPSTMTAPASQLSKTLRRMLVRTQALVEAGIIEQPKWLDAVTRWAPHPPQCPKSRRPDSRCWRLHRLPVRKAASSTRCQNFHLRNRCQGGSAAHAAEDLPRCRCPPEPLVKGHRPKKLAFPEDPLVQSYMTRHPEAKLTPIFLNGSQPAPARVFAERQLQLMQARCVASSTALCSCYARYAPSAVDPPACEVGGVGQVQAAFR